MIHLDSNEVVFIARELFSGEASAGVHPVKRMTTVVKMLNDMIFLFIFFPLRLIIIDFLYIILYMEVSIGE